MLSLTVAIFTVLAIGAIFYYIACGFWELYQRNPIVRDVENENNGVELQTMSIYVQPNPCHTYTSLERLMNLKEKKQSYKLTSSTSL